MKEWGKKNLASLLALCGALIYFGMVLAISFGVGYGASDRGLILKFNELKEIGGKYYGLASAALILGIIAVLPVAIRMILAILNIDWFARLFNAATIVLTVISAILFIVLDVVLIKDVYSVNIGSIVGFYILLVIGFSAATVPVIKK